MAADTELEVSVRESASWSRRLSITVPVDRVRKTRGRVAEQVARGARLPGFRKGKLPQSVIEKRFGPSIDQETLDRLIQEAYREALESQGITPISQGKVDEVEYDKDAPLRFEVEVEVRPEIELARLSGFTASRTPVTVGDDEVDSVIDRLRDERAEWEEIEAGKRPEYGDRVRIEVTQLREEGEGDDEPQQYQIVLGEGQAIPDVEAAILTLAPGEQEEFSVTFPEDFPDEGQRGTSQRLRIELQSAERKVLPELDDSFAKAIGDFESVEAFRSRILEDVKKDAEQRAEGEVRRQLIDQVLEANAFEAPRSMSDRYLDYMLEGPPSERRRPARSAEEQERFESLRESLRPQAEWGLKRTLVIERIAEMEGLRATQDEIDSRVEELAANHGRSASEVWIQLEKNGQIEELEREITEDKVFEYLKAQNQVL